MILDATWQPLATPAALDERTAHVWWLDLDAAGRPGTLDAAERERAERFRDDVHRQRFVRRRTIMRDLLAAYAGCSADEISYERAASGKPRLRGTALTFSVSQSEGNALLAIARRVEIGVDIERFRTLDDVEDLARTFMTQRLQNVLARVQPSARSKAFLNLWTIVEACVKADGRGLAGLPIDPDAPGAHTYQPLKASRSHAATFAAYGGIIERVASFRMVERAR